jgi:hypothetical protein
MEIIRRIPAMAQRFAVANGKKEKNRAKQILAFFDDHRPGLFNQRPSTGPWFGALLTAFER